ncbi:MAG: alpha/beta hydrolase [Methylocystis silviterrae]|uniref:alpha/beta fold hydrolase n=1 Tax=Methylocystis silviterrae TaxID=2743612 RepID=UPI003BBD119E
MTASTNAAVVDELIEMRGLRFHFRDWRSRRVDAPSLVLLHGYTSHARSWDAFAEAMTDRYHVLALDQRGHGETGWAAADRYGVDDMADDLETFVQALGLRGFTLLGLSMGGMVAMEYAGRRPKPLAACVIVDIGPETVQSGSSRIQASVQAVDVFADRDEAFAAARAANSRPPEELHRHRSDASLMRTEDGRWTYRYDRALRSPPNLRRRDPETAWRSCANINVPTQIIRGELSDILSPMTAERMVRTIPDARLATVADAGHGVPLDAPEAFLAAAREFLKG